jgi:hypothetical protein
MSRTDRKVFARRWAEAIAGTSYVSMERDELVAHLLGLTHQLAKAALATEFDPSAGRRIGVDLVVAHFTGTETLGETLAVIVERLPGLLVSTSKTRSIALGCARAGRLKRQWQPVRLGSVGCLTPLRWLSRSASPMAGSSRPTRRWRRSSVTPQVSCWDAS